MTSVDIFASQYGFEDRTALEAFLDKHKPVVMPEHSELMAAVADGFNSALDMREDHAIDTEYVTRRSLKFLMQLSHGNAVNAGWYHDVNTGQWKNLNVGERFMLMVTELTITFLTGLTWRSSWPT
jgi:hypothetical protein